MDNILTKSFLSLIFSFLLSSIVIFFFNNVLTLDNYILLLKYITFELMGFIVFFSQFVFILMNKKFSNFELIINTILCSFLIVIFHYFFIDSNFIYFNSVKQEEIFIARTYSLLLKNEILYNRVVQYILNDIHMWDLDSQIFQSSFSLLLFNISVQSFFKRLYNGHTLYRVLVLLFTFAFYLYFWNSTLNLYIFLLSILILKIKRK